ncbi:hypothetical protein [Catenulispora rubra]|uniref:hypothetical protein n=1 Tax=Catenulispora rubra TaxID=280293 RepID=UPI001891F69A|nr:hypothetical protein [Catenulispora rubra]
MDDLIDDLTARARALWTHCAAAPVEFPVGGGIAVVTSPQSTICPRGWVASLADHRLRNRQRRTASRRRASTRAFDASIPQGESAEVSILEVTSWAFVARDGNRSAVTSSGAELPLSPRSRSAKIDLCRIRRSFWARET